MKTQRGEVGFGIQDVRLYQIPFMEGPHNYKDYLTWGSMLGCPYLGNLPCSVPDV